MPPVGNCGGFSAAIAASCAAISGPVIAAAATGANGPSAANVPRNPINASAPLMTTPEAAAACCTAKARFAAFCSDCDSALIARLLAAASRSIVLIRPSACACVMRPDSNRLATSCRCRSASRSIRSSSRNLRASANSAKRSRASPAKAAIASVSCAVADAARFRSSVSFANVSACSFAAAASMAAASAS